MTVLAIALSLGLAAHADTSLILGAVFPGWERVDGGGLESSATSLARDYAMQIGHTCIHTEVFIREGTRSIITAEVFYEGFLPVGSTERILLESIDQCVALISSGTMLSDALSVMVTLDDAVVLILC